MSIRVQCGCGHQFSAPEKYAGKKVKCPKCTQGLLIPSSATKPDPPKTTSAKAQVATKSSSPKPASDKIAVKCSCGKVLAAKAEWAGKAVKCPACQKAIKIPTAAAKKPAPTASPQKPAASHAPKANAPKANTPKTKSADADDLFDELGIGTKLVASDAKKRCPECRSPMADEAILCIDCGYNETLGRKMVVQRPVTQDDRDRKAKRRRW